MRYYPNAKWLGVTDKKDMKVSLQHLQRALRALDSPPNAVAKQLRLLDSNPRVPAAVLVPLIGRDQWTLLFTRRTAHLSQHAGQISFPGGRAEPGDCDAVAVAIRETQEEIGIKPAQIQPIGYLDWKFLPVSTKT